MGAAGDRRRAPKSQGYDGGFLVGSRRLADRPLGAGRGEVSIPRTDRSAGESVFRSWVYDLNARLSCHCQLAIPQLTDNELTGEKTCSCFPKSAYNAIYTTATTSSALSPLAHSLAYFPSCRLTSTHHPTSYPNHFTPSTRQYVLIRHPRKVLLRLRSVAFGRERGRVGAGIRSFDVPGDVWWARAGGACFGVECAEGREHGQIG
jgi:hypothetical protein